MEMAHCGESVSHTATHGVEKGVCHFEDLVLDLDFTRRGFSVVVAGVGVEIFLFETGGHVGIVHLDKLKVSEGFAYVGEFIMVSCIVESIVSEFMLSCEHFKKNVCVTNRGERCFTGSFQNPC
jgi:hypothetical protein